MTVSDPNISFSNTYIPIMKLFASKTNATNIAGVIM